MEKGLLSGVDLGLLFCVDLALGCLEMLSMQGASEQEQCECESEGAHEDDFPVK
jgi:hypothetical protein